MTWIQETLKYPDKCYFNQKLPKKQIYENAKINTRDKNIFTKNIEEMMLSYYFNTETLNISPYQDDKRRYTEIAIFEIKLRRTTKLNRIAEIILRSVPYPSIIIFETEECVRLYASHIREHGSDTTKITLDEENGMIYTDWINILETDNLSEKLFNDIKIENLSYINFYEFYSNIYDAIVEYNGSRLKGDQTLLNPKEIKKRLDTIRKLKYEISSDKKQIGEETNFNEQVKLNMKIKELNDKIEAIIKEL